MSLIGDMLSRGLETLAEATDQPCIEWRAGTTGDWSPLLASTRFEVEGSSLGYSDQDGGETQEDIATLITSMRDELLGPQTHQVRVDGDDDNIWTVTDGPTGVGTRRYQLARAKRGTLQSNRGRLG